MFIPINRKASITRHRFCPGGPGHISRRSFLTLLAAAAVPAQAQTGLDRFCVRVGDARPRRRVDGTATTVAGLAADEALRPMPTAPFPAILSADAQISAQALVCFRGNSYSVGPGMAGTTVTVAHRLGTATLDIVSPGGVVLARHRRQPDSAGAVMRWDGLRKVPLALLAFPRKDH